MTLANWKESANDRGTERREIVLTVRLTESEWKELAARAEQEARTIANVVRRAVAAYMRLPPVV